MPGQKRVLIPAGGAYGASDIPGSLVTLSPNDTLVIRASASLKNTGVWSGASASPVNAKVAIIVDESRYHDTRFDIIGTSRVGTATSALPLTWSDAK